MAIGPREGVLLGANLGRAIVTNGDFTAYVCMTVPRRGPLPKLLRADLFVYLRRLVSLDFCRAFVLNVMILPFMLRLKIWTNQQMFASFRLSHFTAKSEFITTMILEYAACSLPWWTGHNCYRRNLHIIRTDVFSMLMSNHHKTRVVIASIINLNAMN